MSRIAITPTVFKNDFIIKANEIYKNNTFDFSLIPNEFLKTDRLNIICNKHGKFTTTYYMFIEKQCGCKECKKEFNKEQRRLYYQEKFINESNIKHNYFYNYDKVNYQGKNVKVIITCPIHGDFEQTPHEHKSGSGCKECARERLIAQNRKTTEWFIDKANKKHNYFYNYEKTKYTTSNEKVIVTCPIHGDFEIAASSHLSGHGCPKCANKKKGYGKGNKPIPKTTEQFINESKNYFGDFYNYDKTNYINARTNVIITCPIHGDFEVTPNKHLSEKVGCPKCSIDKIKQNYSKKTEDFITESRNYFGDFYNYDKTIYKNSRTPVIITCPIHGDFEITPLKHTSAHHGCPECGKIKSANSNRYTINDLIRVGNLLFHNFYDYSETTFTNIHDEIEIICPIHGKFKTFVYAHLNGNGECPECIKIRRQKSFEDFKYAANLIFNDYYSYDESEYVDNNTKMKIICPKHGPFYVTPKEHIRNHKACPNCKMTDIEITIASLLENNNIKYEKQKTFDWLKYKNNMYLDFYISEINIAIECQGPQHFMLCEYLGYNNETFELYKQRDIQKKKLCEEHGIEILYFSKEQFVEMYELGTLYINKNEIIKIILEKIKLLINL